MLDLSKVLMQDFHYNYVQNKYSEKNEVLLTNTEQIMNLKKQKTLIKISFMMN